MINIKNLSKTYNTKLGNVKALNDISLELPNKGFICICGKNGSGKSTLLNCLSLLDDNYEGNISLDSYSYEECNEVDKQNIRKNVFGYIFQKNNLIQSLSAEQNIKLVSKVYPHMKIEEQELDVSLPLKRYPKQMSGGQQQKTAIYRALFQKKPIIICDEPNASLDYENTIIVFEELKRVSKEKLVICVCHNDDLVHRYADRIIELDQGEVKQDITINEHTKDDLLHSFNKDINKVSYANLLKLGFSFILTKPFLTMIYLMISILIFIGITFLSSYITFDSKTEIVNLIQEDKFYSPIRYLDSEYNGTTIKSDIMISNRIITECEQYLKEDGFYYSIPEIYDGVLFIKNSGISIGEGHIGLETLKKIYNQDSLSEPIDISITNEFSQTINIKLVSTFEGKGIKCDYESSKMYTNDYIIVNGGLWLNSTMNKDTLAIEKYINMSIVYYPVSYVNSITDLNLELEIDDVIISQDLLMYLDDNENHNVTFISRENFSNDELFYRYPDMNKIYSKGMNIIGSLSNDNNLYRKYKFVIINDEKYKMIEDNTVFFSGVSIAGTKKKEMVNMFLDGGYSFYNDNESQDTIEIVLRVSQDIEKVRDEVLFIIICLFMILVLVSILFIHLIFKYDATKIGILRCLGLNKFQSFFSSFITFELLLMSSFVVSMIIALSTSDKLNYSFITSLYENGIEIFKVNPLVVVVNILFSLLLNIIFFAYIWITNKNKSIKDYFVVD